MNTLAHTLKSNGAAPRLKVFIHTVASDIHTKVISFALEKRGHAVVKWFGGDYPKGASVSVASTKGAMNARFSHHDNTFFSSDIDVVWNRRRMHPSAPSDVSSEDSDFVTKELEAAFLSHDLFFTNAFWINEFKSADLSELKLLQMRDASSVGLRMPETLVSNDPDAIKEFLLNTPYCIYKPLTGYVWSHDGEKRSTFTASISLNLLPKDDLLKAVPGIYQERIKKKYEVRAQFLGNYCAAIIIDSIPLADGHLDWRLNQGAIESCQAIQLPAAIYKKCRALMKRLNIVSGGFDFIVDDHDEWIFLEVNEAGQFLFLEHWCKEIHLVEAFCQFIESMDSEFTYTATDKPLLLREIFDEIG